MELREVGARIRGSDDWIRELLALGDRALQTNRRLPAAYYFRMAEFFRELNHPRHASCRETFLALVLAEHRIDASMRHRVPYGDAEVHGRLAPAAAAVGNPRRLRGLR